MNLALVEEESLLREERKEKVGYVLAKGNPLFKYSNVQCTLSSGLLKFDGNNEFC